MMVLRGAVALLALAALAIGVAPAARAADDGSTVVFGVGYADVIDGDSEVADFRIDYRHGEGLWFIKPWAGLEVNTDAAVWGGGGIYIDLPIYDRVYLTGSTGVGLYSDGNGKDLGHTIEFRSQAEVTYRFDNGMRLGAALSHISNASLGETNPGANIVSAIYVVPLGTLLPD